AETRGRSTARDPRSRDCRSPRASSRVEPGLARTELSALAALTASGSFAPAVPADAGRVRQKAILDRALKSPRALDRKITFVEWRFLRGLNPRAFISIAQDFPYFGP